MADSISHTTFDDAPLSAARKPDVESLNTSGFSAERGDSLIGRTVTIDSPPHQTL